MTTLNSTLQLALLKRKKARNKLEKGFTLVELMIVIVIVGILSAVALPNFLSQQNKAKITEATSKLATLGKSAHADFAYSSDAYEAFVGASNAATDANKGGIFTYVVDPATTTCTTTSSTTSCALSTPNVMYFKATPKSGGSSGGDAALYKESSNGTESIWGCVNLETGKIDNGKNFATTAATSDASCV